MSRFRSKPVEIQAVQFNQPGDHEQVVRTATGYTVFGNQGWSNVNLGDWIIDEPFGTGHYPCDPETFARKYEPVA